MGWFPVLASLFLGVSAFGQTRLTYMLEKEGEKQIVVAKGGWHRAQRDYKRLACGTSAALDSSVWSLTSKG